MVDQKFKKEGQSTLDADAGAFDDAKGERKDLLVSVIEDGRKLAWSAVLKNNFPEDLRQTVSWFCREDEALLQQCDELFNGFGREGLEIVLSLKFLQNIKIVDGETANANAVRQDTANIRQEVILLMALFRTIRGSCRDFQVDPLILMGKLVKSKPGVALLELLDMVQQVVVKMITQAYLIRYQQRLLEVDWDWDEFWILAQNFEMVMRHDGRDQAFKYLRSYIDSCSGVRPSRKNLH